MTEIPGMFVISWDHEGYRYVIDVDEGAIAAVSTGLAEGGRENIRVLGPFVAEVPDEVAAAVSERVMARLREQRPGVVA